MRGVEPVMDDIFHQHLLTHATVRQAGESTSDDFYGGDKPDDYYDDLNDGPEGEDKHPDPFVQRMREKEKNANRFNEFGMNDDDDDFPDDDDSGKDPDDYGKDPEGYGKDPEGYGK